MTHRRQEVDGVQRRGDPLVVGRAVDPRHVLRRQLVPLEARLHDAQRRRVQDQDAPGERVGPGRQGPLGLRAARVAEHLLQQPISNLLLQRHLGVFVFLSVQDARIPRVDNKFVASGILFSAKSARALLLAECFVRPIEFYFVKF